MRANMIFENLDLDGEFKEYDGKVAGISERVLSNDMDRDARRGKRTRLLRLAPGVQTPAAHAHDYWEEIYVIKGRHDRRHSGERREPCRRARLRLSRAGLHARADPDR